MSDAPRNYVPYTDPPEAAMDAPPPLVIYNEPGELLVAIHPDGRLEYGPDYDPDEAARRFWAALALHMPAQQAGAELVRARETIARLRGLLAEVMAQFVHRTHPGEPCLQTGHVRVATVERWREALRS